MTLSNLFFLAIVFFTLATFAYGRVHDNLKLKLYTYSLRQLKTIHPHAIKEIACCVRNDINVSQMLLAAVLTTGPFKYTRFA